MQRKLDYHAVEWNEPIIYELEDKAVKTSVVPDAEEDLVEMVGDVTEELPDSIVREDGPNLPNLSEPELARHFTRLSQQTAGVDTHNQTGLGTCTMKYNPKMNDELATLPEVADVHPDQNPETVQGLLELMYHLQDYLAEVAGMDAFSLQPRGGAHGVLTNAFITRAYHESKGQLDEKDEIITSVISHPCDAGAPAMAGFEVINLYPDEETGIPSPEAFEEAISERTAGMMITNPYDTGKYDHNMREYIEMVHDVDGIVVIDQANLNGVMGKIRVGDIGADLCHFNLHKSFGVPHGSYGPASGPIGAKERLEKFLPVPVVEKDGDEFYFEYDRPDSIGKAAGFYGTVPGLVRAYAWIRRMGASGLEEAAEAAVLNNNYLVQQLVDIEGITLPPEPDYRIQEARMSLEQLAQDTGVGTDDVDRRIVDFGVQNNFKSHHPMVIPEPFTPEPTEAVSRGELDRWVAIMEQISNEAYSDPEIVKQAPHNAPIGKIDEDPIVDPEKMATTWRAYKRKQE